MPWSPPSLWRRSETSRQEAEAEALRAEASKLLALGQRELETDPTAALAYALKSVELADTEGGRVFALRVLQHAPTMIVTPADLPPGLETRTARFSPDGEWLALGGHGKVQLLHRDGRPPILLGDYAGTGSGIATGFGPRNDVLVANRHGDLRVWSLPEGRELRRGAFEEGSSALWVRADGFLTSTTVGPRGVIRWWPFGDGESHLRGSMEASRVADVSREWLAYADGRKIFLRSLEHWTSSPRLLAEHRAEVGNPELGAMAFSPDGERLAVFDASGEVRIWSTAERLTHPLRILLAREMRLSGLAFDAEGTKLALGGTERGRPTVRVWDLRAPPAAEPLVLRRGGSHSLTAVAFDPSGHWIVTGHLLRGAAFWPLDESQPHSIAQHEGDVRSIAFTGDGERLVSSSDDGTVRVWPLSPAASGERRWLIGERVPARMAVDPKSPRTAVTGGGQVRLLPLDGGPPRNLQGAFPDYKEVAVAFGDEGRLVAAAGGPPMTVRVWNLETGAVWSIGVSPVVAGGGDVHFEQLWFVGRDCLLASGWTYTPHRSPDPGLLRLDLRDGTVRVLGPEPNGSFAISNGAEFGVGVRNLAPPLVNRSELVRFRIAGGPSMPLPAHGFSVVSVALDPTDSVVATGSDDGTVRIGRVTGEEPHVLLGHQGAVWAVAFSPDGRWLASGGADRTIRLWPVPDISNTPLHKRPYEQFLAAIRSHTNLRAVPDTRSPTGWELDAGPFLGWAKLPEQ